MKQKIIVRFQTPDEAFAKTVIDNLEIALALTPGCMSAGGGIDNDSKDKYTVEGIFEFPVASLEIESLPSTDPGFTQWVQQSREP